MTRGPQYVVCPKHPAISYLEGGFCEDCYHEETLGRIRSVDEGFAELMATAQSKFTEVLSLPIAGEDLETLKVTVRPVLKAIEMLTRRFRRPEQIDVKHKVQKVSIVGSPMDFAEAARKKAEEGQGEIIQIN